MNRLEKKLQEVKESKRRAVSVFLTAGFPSWQATEKLVPLLYQTGVDFFEIGFPFSDPIADGKVIQESSQIALENGADWNRLLLFARKVRAQSEAPLVLMSYANPVYQRGWKTAARELMKAGFDGVIIPDLIPEEEPQLPRLFQEHNISLIYLVAPTSGPDRIQKICQTSSGFVYCVSVTGVTGAGSGNNRHDFAGFAKSVTQRSPLPVLMGFGVNSPEQIRKYKKCVDGFIIGSAVIKILFQKKPLHSLCADVAKFITPFIKESKIS